MTDINTMSSRNGRVLKEDSEYINIADIIEALNVKDGFHITDTERNALAEGKSYCATNIIEAAAQNVLNIFHFKSGSKIAIVVYEFVSDGAFRTAVYKEPTITGDGTNIGGFSRNFVTQIEKTSNIYLTPTYSNIGTKIAERQDAASVGPAKGGTEGISSRLLILPPNTSMFYTATNKSTTTSVLTMTIDWIEIDVE